MNGEDVASLEIEVSQSRSNVNGEDVAGEDVASLELQIEGSQGFISII